MFEQEVSSGCQLVVHDLDGELQVLYGGSALLVETFSHAWPVSESIKLIPRREVFALKAQHH